MVEDIKPLGCFVFLETFDSSRYLNSIPQCFTILFFSTLYKVLYKLSQKSWTLLQYKK